MRVVQTAFGVFHAFDLARALEARGFLTQIFSTWPWARLRREGLPRNKVTTFPWIHTPEYLLGRYRLLLPWMADAMSYANALAFDAYTSRRIPDCDILVALSGSSLRTGKIVQGRGGLFLCDHGSSHARAQNDLLADEYRRWKIYRRPSDPRDIAREEAIYAQADHIVVPSLFAQRSFLEQGVSSDCISVIPYGMSLERFRPVAAPPREIFEVVFVGSVSLRKGIPYLLQAFANVKVPRKRLRIVGSVHPEIEALLAGWPVEDVEFLGSVPQTELPAILSSSHLFVLPSIEDGFGMVLGQAMACGCPVLASTNSGGPEYIQNGENGFVVPVRDVRAMTHRMQLLADEPETQQRMRMACLNTARQLGGWEQYGNEWELLLNRLLGRNDPQP